MAAGDVLLDDSGNRILDADGKVLLSNAIDDSACCCGTAVPLLNCDDDAYSGKTITAVAAGAHVTGDTVKLADGTCYYLDDPSATAGEDVSSDIDSWPADCATCCECPASTPSSVTLTVTFECPCNNYVTCPSTEVAVVTLAIDTALCTGSGGSPFGAYSNCIEVIPGGVDTVLVYAGLVLTHCGWQLEVTVYPNCNGVILFKNGTDPLGNYGGGTSSPSGGFPGPCTILSAVIS